jgi:hypothetical protein
MKFTIKLLALIFAVLMLVNFAYAETDTTRLFRQIHTKQECIDFYVKNNEVTVVEAEDWCREFDGNLVFQISNQSPNVDPVDFLVSLDGKHIIEKELPFADAHHVEMIAVQVPLGKHVILVESKNGGAKLRHAITVKNRLYVNISYWYYTEKEPYGPVKRQFEIKTSSQHAFATE